MPRPQSSLRNARLFAVTAAALIYAFSFPHSGCSPILCHASSSPTSSRSHSLPFDAVTCDAAAQEAAGAMRCQPLQPHLKGAQPLLKGD